MCLKYATVSEPLHISVKCVLICLRMSNLFSLASNKVLDGPASEDASEEGARVRSRYPRRGDFVVAKAKSGFVVAKAKSDFVVAKAKSGFVVAKAKSGFVVARAKSDFVVSKPNFVVSWFRNRISWFRGFETESRTPGGREAEACVTCSNSQALQGYLANKNPPPPLGPP